ncbi:MAG TPA: glutamyl-tRNA reductase, partial [Candidatus Nanopelagicales bacterium]
MTLLVLGASHRSAPLGLLEELALTQAEADRLAADATGSDVISEAIVLATCNRIEVYADVTRFHPAIAALTELLAKATGADLATLREHSYVHFDSAAVAHLFAVAAGLDSMVVGEAQILGQVRAALVRGQEHGTAGRELNAAVQRALHVGKRAHAETGIDRSGQSVVSVALEAAAGIVGDLGERRVVVVGAGSMGSLAAATLAARGARDLVVVNRTAEAGRRLAAAVPGGRAIGYDALGAALATADVVISCTGAQDLVLHADEVTQARAGTHHPLVVLDLALPHDTDPAIDALPRVTRIDLPWLAAHPAAAATEADVAAARSLVAEEVEAHLASLAAQQVEPTLVSLRAHAGSVIDSELSRLRLRLAGADEHLMAEVERSMRRAVARLLHNPTVRMKQLAAEPGGDRYAAA